MFSFGSPPTEAVGTAERDLDARGGLSVGVPRRFLAAGSVCEGLEESAAGPFLLSPLPFAPLWPRGCRGD